jgi:hypothetical protein
MTLLLCICHRGRVHATGLYTISCGGLFGEVKDFTLSYLTPVVLDAEVVVRLSNVANSYNEILLLEQNLFKYATQPQ